MYYVIMLKITKSENRINPLNKAKGILLYDYILYSGCSKSS